MSRRGRRAWSMKQGGSAHEPAVCRSSDRGWIEFCAGQLGAVRWLPSGILRVLDAVQPDRHDLWRQWHDEFRPAGPSRARSARRRSGTRAAAVCPRPDRRRRVCHAHERPNLQVYSAWAPGSGDGDHADAQFSGRSRHARRDHADLRDRRDAHRPRDQHSRAQRGGSGLPHENRQPSTTVTYIISLFGIYPHRKVDANWLRPDRG